MQRTLLIITIVACMGQLAGSASATPPVEPVIDPCPKFLAAKVKVEPGNRVTLEAKVRTSYARLGSRITLRRADTGRVSFAFAEVLPFETAHPDWLYYAEELPLDQPRTRMILRATLRHPACAPAVVERTFWSIAPFGSVAP